MSCPCDVRVFPPALVITAGLPELPRQIAGFPEFRAALLAAIPRHPALHEWRARGDDDFGVMLLEMWAYVCDVVSFYDKVIADEGYLRTAKLRPSVRKLTSLLGYVPRPAAAASVRLALLADGRQPITVPVGTAFRSGAFGGEPPQVFEVDLAATAHPALNSFPVAPPRRARLSGAVSSLLLEPRTAIAREHDVVLADFGGSLHVRRIAKTERTVDSDGRTYVRIDFDSPVTLGAPVDVSAVKLWKPTQKASLRSPVVATEEAPLFDDIAVIGSGGSGLGLTLHYLANATFVTLDGIYAQIKKDDRVLVSLGPEYRTSVVHGRFEQAFTVAPSAKFTVDGKAVTTPAVAARYSQLTLIPPLSAGSVAAWGESDAPNISVHFGLVEAGRAATSAATGLGPSDTLQLVGARAPTEPPAPERFFLVDGEDRGVEVPGTLVWANGVVTPDPGTSWSPDLRLPVTAHGNVVDASRGETVSHEVLGNGDASLANQSFTLKKSPLTYLPSAENESGVASTLTVWVDGVAWTEVPSFFGQPPDAPVYVVRSREDGKAVATFGDGVNASRLSTGIGNVFARYRFGAGEASPPAGSIRQLAKPVAGLRGAVNPVAAAGGADAESGEEIKAKAPRSALLLGRAVSIDDMEAAASIVPGVVAVSASWRWEGKRQQPVVKVFYVGAPGLEVTVSRRLRGLSDPSTPIDVEVATPLTPTLAVDVETDARRLAEAVARAVHDALLDPDSGLLARARIGIGRALFRSRIFEAVLAVPGALGVRSLQWNGVPWNDGAPDGYGRLPDTGRYFDFEAGNLIVTGAPSHA